MSGDGQEEEECGNCEEHPAVISCEECGEVFCAECNRELHKPAKLATHNRRRLQTLSNEPRAAPR